MLPPGFLVDAYNFGNCTGLEYIEITGNLTTVYADQVVSGTPATTKYIFRSNIPPSDFGGTAFWGSEGIVYVPYSSDHSILSAYQSTFANVGASFTYQEFRTDDIMPSLYQEVEYLQGDGNAYIDLGINNKSTFGCRLDCRITQSGGRVLCGASSGGMAGNGAFIMDGYVGFRAAYIYEQTYGLPASKRYERVTIQSNYLGSGTGFIEGLESESTQQIPAAASGDTNYSYLLFCIHDYTGDLYSLNNTVGSRVYHFQLSDGNTLVMDLHPCYRKSDNTPGMFDFITRKFFTNANSVGSFTVGERIAPKSPFLIFVDKEVEAVSQNNFNGGAPLTLESLATITSQQFGTTFQNNTQIVRFDEFKCFTGVTTVPSNAFNGCSNLVTLSLPDNLTSLSYQVFMNCSSLNTIRLGTLSQNYVAGVDVFYGANNVKNVYVSSLDD